MKIYSEIKREAMYRNIKYWGKKPHNIWNDLIAENTKKNEVIFDPFSGSNVAFFESIILDRIPVSMDINPLSLFIIEVYSSKYDNRLIVEHFNKIKDKIESDVHYCSYYGNGVCENCSSKNTINNYIWVNNERVEQRFKCKECSHDNLIPLNNGVAYANPVPNWMPYFNMETLTLMSKNSIKKFGGSNISNLYDDYNLYLNTIIFEVILDFKEPYRQLFVLVFLQMVHLTTKMCAVRSRASGRLYSSSWGRPAFLALSKYMEQNPLIQMERSTFGNSGIIKAIESVNDRMRIDSIDKIISSKNELLIEKPTFILGDSKRKVLDHNSVDFIITDPPYGNIIQYGELNSVWNSWLRIAYPEYSVDLDEEIIVNKNQGYEEYSDNLQIVFENCYTYLKPNKKMIFTFNSNKEEDWLVVENILHNSKFKVEEFYLQKNLRSSEANVKANKGMAISDYYIVLIKDILISEKEKKQNNFEKVNKLRKLWKDGIYG